ncbi:hypothetical protein [Halorubrum sp. AJ67]|uniref:hypothetical protein n=1 Tax=Halorubrum sp. AJ67 TaxID=1173487 RepID=UPI0003DD4780|nr:hypothetical protein [Halorubrum sp. AJ67]CDK40595.1 putative membrane protein [Halorubrum sp. AJ67]
MNADGKIQTLLFGVSGVVWVGCGLLVGIGISPFMWGLTLILFGYFLSRLVQETKRLADATEKIAERSK